jgi:hypothetical protein
MYGEGALYASVNLHAKGRTDMPARPSKMLHCSGLKTAAQ